MRTRITDFVQALAYAMWDSVNSVRMERPDDVEYHIARAREVRRFLVLRGFDVARIEK